MRENSYLKAIGIQTWQSTCNLPNAKKEITFDTYVLFNILNSPVAKLCLEVLPTSLSQIVPFNTLLDAMLSAIQLKRVPLVEQNSHHFDVVLLMGEVLAKKVLDSDVPLEKLRSHNIHNQQNTKLIVTYHPLDLLQTPVHKKEAWSDLKLFKSLI